MTDYERDYTTKLERKMSLLRDDNDALRRRLTVARLVVGLCIAAIIALAVRL